MCFRISSVVSQRFGKWTPRLQDARLSRPTLSVCKAKKFSGDTLTPSLSWKDSTLLHSLLKASPTVVSEELGLVAYQMPDRPATALYSLRPDLIYERWFYPDLLATIRQTEKTILIGSPGIGKSHFQFYYLMRLLRATHETEHQTDSLPADSFGSYSGPQGLASQQRMVILSIVYSQTQLLDAFTRVGG